MIDIANEDKADLCGGGLWASDIYGPFAILENQRGVPVFIQTTH